MASAFSFNIISQETNFNITEVISNSIDNQEKIPLDTIKKDIIEIDKYKDCFFGG